MTGPQPPYGGQGGQWPAGSGDWQSPADQTQYSGPSDPAAGPPGYEQPQQYDSYDQPQQYDQFGQAPQQPGYADPYSAPPAPYAEPYSAPPGAPGYDPNAVGMPPPPPAKSGSATPWIIGGVAGVVVLVLIIVVAALMFSRGGGGGGGGTPGGGSGTSAAAGGKYTAKNVTNACDLIDVDAVKKWASTKDKEPDHSENKSDYSSWLSCSARYKGGDYDSASISLSATVGGEDSNMKESYDSAVESAKSSTGSGKENGEVSGVGEAAYFSSYISDSEYSSSLMYDLTVLDDNLLIRISVNVFLGEPDGVSKEDGEKVCKEQAEKVMEGLKA